MKIKLDARLSAIFDMVPPEGVVADIGCDHALLACALIETGRAKHVFACEANLGPLLHAKKTIADNCLSNSIDTVLTNGLTDLPHSTIDTFIIAGMGGELIADIVLTHMWTRNSRFRFILNPMTKEEKLRRLLFENGFTIAKETCVFSDNKLYTVMYVYYTESSCSIEEFSFYTGCHLYSNDFSSQLYISRVIQRLEKKINGVKMSKNAESDEKIEYYKKITKEIKNKAEKRWNDK
ncbi:MAG: class I SAM-dependent methyltransferase [Oscillospiraceae bacterium]|nr:class I SAM-dependent methyltransferase [Oscillospiraceae bacterium]